MIRFNSFILAILLCIISESGKAQDKIITNTNRTIICDISRITEDTLFFKTKVKNNYSSTYILAENVKEYTIEVIEQIDKQLDTSAFYSIKLEDGTGLSGKINSIEKSKISFSDNNFGKILVNGEIIKSYTKEKKDALYSIYLNDGNQLYGSIVERSQDGLVLQTKNLGKVTIATKNIKEIKEIEGNNIKQGVYWFPNPNNTRYLFSPTAINLKKGEGYYQNAYIIANSANYGLSDNFSIGGGVFLPVVLFLTPKFGFKITEKFHAGGGVILALLPESTKIGILYGVTTYGTNEHNITLGAGYGFVENDFTQRPMITLSGMTRISRRVSLVTENWGIPYRNYYYDYNTGIETKKQEYLILFSYGLRLMTEKTTFDFALINNKDIFDVFPIGFPYIDFVFKF